VHIARSSIQTPGGFVRTATALLPEPSIIADRHRGDAINGDRPPGCLAFRGARVVRLAHGLLVNVFMVHTVAAVEAEGRPRTDIAG